MGKTTIRMSNYGELIKAGINNSRALQLQKIARSLHRIDEDNCYYEQSDKRDKRREALERAAESIAKEYGFISYHQSDPRGWSLYLVKPAQLQEYKIGAIYNRGIAVCSC